jgi:hypothetical protein
MCWKLGAKTTKNYMHPQLLELDEGVSNRPELAPLTMQAMHTSTKAHHGLLSALQGIEKLVQTVGSSVWLKLLLEVDVDVLRIVVVNVLVLVLSQLGFFTALFSYF